MGIGWENFQEEKTTPKQRRALYRLGLSKEFVETHIQTKLQAQKLIGEMLETHKQVRAENESRENSRASQTTKTTTDELVCSLAREVASLSSQVAELNKRLREKDE